MKRIVIAEDHDLFRSALKRMLTRFKVVGEASDGDQAIQLVRLTQPDLLILDLSMPTLSGISVIKEIRKQGNSLKILVLSVHDSDRVIMEAINAGCDGYCLKSDSRAKIENAINNLLDDTMRMADTVAGDLLMSTSVTLPVGHEAQLPKKI